MDLTLQAGIGPPAVINMTSIDSDGRGVIVCRSSQQGWKVGTEQAASCRKLLCVCARRGDLARTAERERKLAGGSPLHRADREDRCYRIGLQG